MKRSRKTKGPTFDADGYQTNLTDLNGTPLPDLDKVRAVAHWGVTGTGSGNHRGQTSGSASLRKRR